MTLSGVSSFTTGRTRPRSTAAVRRAQRAEWEFGDDATVVLFAGAVVPEKGVAQLVRAVAQLQDIVPDVWLVVVGGSELWASPSGNARGAGYEGEVRRAARSASPLRRAILERSHGSQYMASDIVAVPSVWDEPHAVSSLRGDGRRPTCRCFAGGRDPRDGRGWRDRILVPSGDERRLRDAILALATDTDLRERMGRAALSRAADFTWTAASRRLESIYAEVLDRAGPSPNDAS